jgi:hypothetical protein
MNREEFLKRIAEDLKKRRELQAEQLKAEQRQNPFAKIENERSIMYVCLN